MATEIENLRTRRLAVTDELAAMSASAAGGRPNVIRDGQSVDQVGYRKSLYEELKMIDERIREIESSENGPWMIQSLE